MPITPDLSLLPIELAAGIAAGVITTVGGMGGGLTLLLILSVLVGPMAALTWTAPALLLGNLHRATRYRAVIDRGLATRLIIGGLVGSAIGALVAVQLPPLALQLSVVAMTILALAKRLTPIAFRVTPRFIIPITFANGAVCATSGGAGLLTAPLLMAAGLTGEAWIATNSVGAVAMHTGRLLGYGAGGLVTADGLVISGLLALAIMVGNEVGVWLRIRMADVGKRRFEAGVMLLVVVMSLAGVARVVHRDVVEVESIIGPRALCGVSPGCRHDGRPVPSASQPTARVTPARGVHHEHTRLSPQFLANSHPSRPGDDAPRRGRHVGAGRR